MTSHPLGPPPPDWARTRDVLHALAEEVIAPERKAIDGRIRLTWLEGGFGTPVLEGDRQIRVDGAELVRDGERSPIDGVDPAAAGWLSDFYAFVLGALEDLRREVGGDDPVIWPEHFDYAIVAGDETAGSRANYGGSPGDGDEEPYLYVGPWQPQTGELWNASTFAGARLGLAELLEAADQRAAARDFFLRRARALEGNRLD